MTQHARRDDPLLGALLNEVNRLRQRVRAQRGMLQDSSSGNELAQCYGALADAMEAYADEASGSGVPLPYRFRDELRLCRSMGRKGQS